MFLVLPVHYGDADRARKTLELSLKLKYQVNHWLIVMYPQTAAPVMEPVLTAAKRAFKNVIDYMIPAEVRDGWPHGPNQMFFEALSFLYRANEADRASNIIQMDPKLENGRFLWWEPDALPLHANWIDRLETEYNVAGKPFMGAKVATFRYQFPFLKDENGQIVLNEFDNARVLDTSKDPIAKVPDGVHMSGVGIYPRAFFNIIEWAVKSLRNNDEPFDVLFKNEICFREGSGNYLQFQPTYLIAHNTRSTNYRIKKDVDGVYVESDPDPKFPSGESRFLWTQDGSVGAVLAHGVKDDSLDAVVLELNGLGTQTVQQIEKPKLAPVTVIPGFTLPEYNAIQVVDPGQAQPVIENDSAELTPQEQAMLKMLMGKASKSGKKKSAKPARAQPDVSHVNPEEFCATLDAEGWQAALKKHGVSPAQGGILKKMRPASV